MIQLGHQGHLLMLKLNWQALLVCGHWFPSGWWSETGLPPVTLQLIAVTWGVFDPCTDAEFLMASPLGSPDTIESHTPICDRQKLDQIALSNHMYIIQRYYFLPVSLIPGVHICYISHTVPPPNNTLWAVGIQT